MLELLDDLVRGIRTTTTDMLRNWQDHITTISEVPTSL
jgi:hypothetical protein